MHCGPVSVGVDYKQKDDKDNEYVLNIVISIYTPERNIIREECIYDSEQSNLYP